MKGLSAVRFKVFFYLVVVPLLVSLYPALQTYRAHEVAQDEAHILAYLDAVARNPSARPAVPGTYRRQPPQRVKFVMEQDLAMLQSEHASLRARSLLGPIGLASALAAALLGLGILLKIRRDSRAARQSLHELLTRYELRWRQVSRRMSLHVALILVALVACVAYECFWAKSNWYTHGYLSILMTLPLWGAILVAARLLVNACRQMAPLDPISLDVLGRAQPRDKMPGLWAWVDGIARRANAPAPDHIVIGLADGFYVTSAPVTTHPQGLVLQGRTLYLPLPYLSALSEAETTAIVGHELGHFAHGDTEQGLHLGMMNRRMIQKIEHMLAENADGIWMSKPSLWALIHWYESFDAAVMHWSRQQEFAADGVGARVTSAEICAQALLRITALIDVFEADGQGAPGEHHVSTLLNRIPQRGLHIGPDVLEHVVTHPIDTHPPTRLRLDALDVRVDEAHVTRACRRPDEHDTTWFTGLLSARAA